MNYLWTVAGKGLLKPLLKLFAVSWFSIYMSLVFTVLFGVRAATYASQHHPYNDDDGRSSYDKRQDDRMDHQDQVIGSDKAERDERHAEALLYRTKQEEDHDRIVRDEAYFTGAMGILSFLQIYLKLVKKDPDPPHYRQNTINRNDQN